VSHIISANYFETGNIVHDYFVFI